MSNTTLADQSLSRTLPPLGALAAVLATGTVGFGQADPLAPTTAAATQQAPATQVTRPTNSPMNVSPQPRGSTPPANDLSNLSIEDLMNIEVISTTRRKHKFSAAAAIDF